MRTKEKKEKRFSAGQLMNRFLGGLKFDPATYAVFEIWDRETRSLVRGCEAVAIHGRKLCVRVPSVVHRQEILFAKKRLLDRINQSFGKRLIHDIEFELNK